MCWLFHQVGRLASDTLTFHQDVAEFHFEDYQRLLHISGCELRQAYLIIDHFALKSFSSSLQSPAVIRLCATQS